MGLSTINADSENPTVAAVCLICLLPLQQALVATPDPSMQGIAPHMLLLQHSQIKVWSDLCSSAFGNSFKRSQHTCQLCFICFPKQGCISLTSYLPALPYPHSAQRRDRHWQATQSQDKQLLVLLSAVAKHKPQGQQALWQQLALQQ